MVGRTGIRGDNKEIKFGTKDRKLWKVIIADVLKKKTKKKF